MDTVLARAWPLVRKNGAVIGLTVLVNIILPVMIYDLTKHSLGDVRALIASSPRRSAGA